MNNHCIANGEEYLTFYGEISHDWVCILSISYLCLCSMTMVLVRKTSLTTTCNNTRNELMAVIMKELIRVYDSLNFIRIFATTVFMTGMNICGDQFGSWYEMYRPSACSKHIHTTFYDNIYYWQEQPDLFLQMTDNAATRFLIANQNVVVYKDPMTFMMTFMTSIECHYCRCASHMGYASIDNSLNGFFVSMFTECYCCPFCQFLCVAPSLGCTLSKDPRSVGTCEWSRNTCKLSKRSGEMSHRLCICECEILGVRAVSNGACELSCVLLDPQHTHLCGNDMTMLMSKCTHLCCNNTTMLMSDSPSKGNARPYVLPPEQQIANLRSNAKIAKLRSDAKDIKPISDLKSDGTTVMKVRSDGCDLSSKLRSDSTTVMKVRSDGNGMGMYVNMVKVRSDGNSMEMNANMVVSMVTILLLMQLIILRTRIRNLKINYLPRLEENGTDRDNETNMFDNKLKQVNHKLNMLKRGSRKFKRGSRKFKCNTQVYTKKDTKKYTNSQIKDMETVVKVANMANALEFITSFPNGHETMCGHKGIQLSRGQTQRIAIERALVKNPKIILLDEAISALDSETKRVVQEEAMDKLLLYDSANPNRNRTMAVIAHRLSTAKYAFDKRIIEDITIQVDSKPSENNDTTALSLNNTFEDDIIQAVIAADMTGKSNTNDSQSKWNASRNWKVLGDHLLLIISKIIPQRRIKLILHIGTYSQSSTTNYNWSSTTIQTIHKCVSFPLREMHVKEMSKSPWKLSSKPRNAKFRSAGESKSMNMHSICANGIKTHSTRQKLRSVMGVRQNTNNESSSAKDDTAVHNTNYKMKRKSDDSFMNADNDNELCCDDIDLYNYYMSNFGTSVCDPVFMDQRLTPNLFMTSNVSMISMLKTIPETVEFNNSIYNAKCLIATTEATTNKEAVQQETIPLIISIKTCDDSHGNTNEIWGISIVRVEMLEHGETTQIGGIRQVSNATEYNHDKYVEMKTNTYNDAAKPARINRTNKSMEKDGNNNTAFDFRDMRNKNETKSILYVIFCKKRDGTIESPIYVGDSSQERCVLSKKSRVKVERTKAKNIRKECFISDSHNEVNDSFNDLINVERSRFDNNTNYGNTTNVYKNSNDDTSENVTSDKNDVDRVNNIEDNNVISFDAPSISVEISIHSEVNVGCSKI